MDAALISPATSIPGTGILGLLRPNIDRSIGPNSLGTKVKPREFTSPVVTVAVDILIAVYHSL